MELRGIRNNNPGNIDKGEPWDGLAPVQPDPRFCTFIDAPHGIRAIHKILQAYHNSHNLDTISQYISRWAPPSENNTPAYVKDVDGHMPEVTADEPIDIMNPHTAFELVSGIISHENAGFQYPDEVVWLGLKLAGVQVG